MAAAQTQKRASANAGTTAAKRRAASRASSARTSTSRSRTATAASSRSRSGRAASSRTRRPKRSPARARLAALAALAAVVLVAWTIYPVLRLQYQHQREVQTLEAELTGLKSRNADLRKQVDELKTPQGVEEMARDTLGMVKPGEQAYVVTGGALGETSGSVLPRTTGEPSLWQRALDALFGLN